MPKNDRPSDPPKSEETSTSPAQGNPGPGTPIDKKKLTLDVTDVNEVLERKISP
jgi:hypothetical protein